MKNLIEFCKYQKFVTPIRLEIRMDKLTNRLSATGNQSRYFHVTIEGIDVSKMVADAAGLRCSKAKDTYGDVIVHGSGMDMAFALQNRIYKRAAQIGEKSMFSPDYYICKE